MTKGLNPCDMKHDSDCLKIQKYIIDLLKEPVADYVEDENIHSETVSVTDFIITNPKSLSDFINQFQPSWEQPDNAVFDTKTINKLKIMQRNDYIKSKSNKVNTYVEFSGRQTGKTTRLIQRALLESYQNNVVIFVNKLDGQRIIKDKVLYSINNVSVQSPVGSLQDLYVTEYESKNGKMFYNKLSDKFIIICCNYNEYLRYHTVTGRYSFFFEEAAFNSNIGFLSHKEILENIAPNGLLYFSTTLKNFLQKKSPVVTDFQEDPMQFLYEEFGIDVNLRKLIPEKCDYHDIEQQKLEEGYLFKTVGQTIYE